MKKLALDLNDVTKTFQKDDGYITAVDKVSLQVEEGEMVTFLGPSGCGKTTTLRMVAGFELPTSGSITIRGSDMTNTPVNKRKIGFVFQNYALFPHMSVYNNVAYGLKARGEKDKDIRDKVRDALVMVGLVDTENRYPSQLSGGEQQRVALARVIVMEPNLLLMDEPLSNLDAKLRIHMRTEIRRLQKKLGITCLYVTHDQSEALSMADRIVVMNKGKVEQVGTAFEIYSNPQSLFVADFIGQANIIHLKVTSLAEDVIGVQTHNGGVFSARCIIPDHIDSSVESYEVGKDAALVIRPESLTVIPYKGGEETFNAVVSSSVFVGSHVEYELTLPNNEMIKAFIPYTNNMQIFKEEEQVSFMIDPVNALFLPRKKNKP
ncbi:MAG TPA: ABC transporter ATP-binding protein [Spirochaetales bacterium]|jgi:iron(III) transport system ATP-binding protein|nr:ABC transporter ATP-binding protein [Spirochaetales bacterium]